MKAIKYLMMGVLTFSFSTSVMAQDGSKADIDAVKRIISNKPADLDKQMKPYYKENRKNAENLIGFARAFFEVKDTANAKKYAEFALTASKNKCAPAYILLGDIEALSDDGGSAAQQYEQAIYADPKLVEAYYKYALVYRKIDPRGAAAKLDELKANRPDVSVDAIKGHIFMIAGDRKSAYTEFKKVPVSQLDKSYLNEFARASYFQGHFEDALAACEQGLKDKPRNATFTRLAMFSNYELKNYDAAKAYIHKYFNETDSAKYSEYDHYYSALIYDALGEHQNAFSEYDKALVLVNDSSMIKKWAILKTLSDAYLKNKDFVKATDYYKQMLAAKKELTYDDEEGLANIYTKDGDASGDAAKKAEMIKKADEVYAALIQKYPTQEVYSTYMRANLNNKLDNNMEKALAKPYYEKLASLLSSRTDRTKGQDTMLKTAYHYLMFNAYINKNVDGAKAFAGKILQIDPEYKAALEIQALK
jgi:tetratricopeptide (TPR) repeat protein